MISRTHLFADLGQPIQSLGTQVRTSDVYAVRPGERRKRPELAVAADNEGIRIYDVHDASVSISYGVPPDCQFTCAARSICTKDAHGLGRRLTFCALNPSDGTPRLHCFSERMCKAPSLDRDLLSTSKELAAGKIPVFLEAISSGKTIVLVVIFKDGHVAKFSQDLEEVQWLGRQCEMSGLKEVLTMTCTKAQEGFLKEREDVFTTIGKDARNTTLLVLVRDTPTKATTKRLKIDIFAALSRGEGSAKQPSKLRFSLSLLCSVQLHVPGAFRQGFDCLLHSGGQLLIWNNARIQAFQLTGSSLHCLYSLDFNEPLHSVIRLSSSLIAIIKTSTIEVLDVKHFAIYAECSVNPTETSQIPSTSDSEKITNKSRLLSFYPRSQTLLLLHERALISFTMNTTNMNQTEESGSAPLTLADFFGKGLKYRDQKQQKERTISLTFGTVTTIDVTPNKTWSKLTRLTNYAQQLKSKGFERKFLELIGAITGKHDPSWDDKVSLSINVLANIHGMLFNFEKPTRDKPRGKLMVRFMPLQSFKWLAQNNFMSKDKVEQALRRSRVVPPGHVLEDSAVPKALAAFDSSLQMLVFYLTSPTSLTISEVISSMDVALDVIQKAQSPSIIKHMLDGESNSDSDSDTEMPDSSDEEDTVIKEEDIANGEKNSANVGEDVVHSSMESRMENQDPDRAEPETEQSSGPEPDKDAEKVHEAQAIMKACLNRLSKCSNNLILCGLREELAATTLPTLIDFLRTEMAGSGCLSHYIPDETQADNSQGERSDIVNIVKMLNCAVTALNLVGWHNMSQGDHVNRIQWLKAEISAALEASEEATYLEGLLHQALIYAKNEVAFTGHHDPANIPEWCEDARLLPLGLKPKGHLDTGKVENGKPKKRTPREIGHMKSQLVRQYGLEQINV